MTAYRAVNEVPDETAASGGPRRGVCEAADGVVAARGLG